MSDKSFEKALSELENIVEKMALKVPGFISIRIYRSF